MNKPCPQGPARVATVFPVGGDPFELAAGCIALATLGRGDGGISQQSVTVMPANPPATQLVQTPAMQIFRWKLVDWSVCDSWPNAFSCLYKGLCLPPPHSLEHFDHFSCTSNSCWRNPRTFAPLMGTVNEALILYGKSDVAPPSINKTIGPWRGPVPVKICLKSE